MKNIFVIFNGPPRCGKDTAKEAITSFYKSFVTTIEPVILTFSTVLQKAVPELYAIDKDEWDERYNSDEKDEPWDKLFGISQRQAVIELAEKHLKRLHGPDVFSDIMLNMVDKIRSNIHEKDDVLFLMDTGFDEEFQAFVNRVGKENCLYVKVDRPGCNFDNDSRSYISQQYLSGVRFVELMNDSTEQEWFNRISESILPIIHSMRK